MRVFGQAYRPWLAAAGCAISCSAWAVTVSPSSVSIAAGASQTVKIAKVSGAVSVSNSRPEFVTVVKLDSTTYRIGGSAAGTAVVQFRDRRSTAQVNVAVTGAPAGALAGRLLASNCFQCHGTNGTGGFDRLAGKSANEIYGELREFASGKEDADGIMAAHAMGFSDAQLKSIATYFASVR